MISLSDQHFRVVDGMLLFQETGNILNFNLDEVTIEDREVVLGFKNISGISTLFSKTSSGDILQYGSGIQGQQGIKGNVGSISTLSYSLFTGDTTLTTGSSDIISLSGNIGINLPI